MTFLMPHKPINTLKARNHEFLRASYHGSIGRPDRSVKRRSAVELLQESKAYYVKSESVLDGRQELKNTDHFNIRSPTRVEVVSTLPRGGSHHHHCLPLSCYAVCPTCYPHSYTPTNKDHLHLDHFQLQTLQEHYLLHYEQLQRESRDVFRACAQSKVDRKLRRSSVPSPATFQLHAFQMERNAFPAFDHSTASPFATVEKNTSSVGRVPSLEFLSSSVPPLPKINQGIASRPDEIPLPPPLPPKSPRATTKPIRPHDFPQRLKSQGEGSPELLLIQPPPPPRRNSDQHVQDAHAKLRRLVRDRPSLKGRIQSQNHAIAIPVTLPSPILPSTPPPDVVMESPMSDSGPIISPPPAFSTPVTPMIDRQNSTASEKSNLSKVPLFSTSGSMSVVSGSSSKSRKSIVDRKGSGNASISDISMRLSSKSPSSSESTSSPSPMSRSPLENGTNASADDDSSRRSPLLPPRPLITKKYPSIPKSVTENTLYRVGSFDSGTREQRNQAPIETQARHHSISSQTEGNPIRKLASPIRRPILRSKSDLSQRYRKTGSTHLLQSGGFTLVHVDMGTSCDGQSQEFSTASMDGRGRDSRRASRSSVELERFFDMMGLENTDSPVIPLPASLKYVPNGHLSGDSSPVFFSSVSSVDSTARRGGSVDSGDSPGHLQRYVGARTYGYGYTGGGPSGSQTTSSSLVVQHGEPSIVERNARVIKWLFNCRKSVENNRIRR